MPPPRTSKATRRSLACASIRATKQSSSEFYRATTDAEDANRMEGDSEVLAAPLT
jgi:hypothetical protein